MALPGYDRNTSLGRGTTARSLGAKPIAADKDTTPRPSLVNQFTNKVGNVAKQTFHLAENVAGASARFAINTPRYLKEDVQPFLQGVARTVTGDLNHDLDNINKRQHQLDEQTRTYSELYKSGKMSKANYTKALQQIGKDYQDLSKESSTVASKADRGNVVESAAMTAGDILSFGEFGIAEVGGKQAIRAGSKEAINALIDAGASNLEKAAMRIPNVRNLLIRNLEGEGKRLLSESLPSYLAREGRHLAAGLLLKRPIFYQSNVALANSSLNHIMEGDYSTGLKDAAWIGIQALEGGPLGAASKGFSWLKNLTGKLAYGKGSFIDELSARIGDSSRTQIANYVRNNPGSRAEEVFRIAQETNNRVFKGDVNAAVDNFLTSYTGHDLDNLSPKQIVDDLIAHRDADTLIRQESQKLVSAGKLTEDEARRLVPVRWGAPTRDAAADVIRQAGPNPEIQLKAWRNFAAAHGLDNNQLLMDRVELEINRNAGGTGDVFSAIKELDAAQTLPQAGDALKAKLAKLGYVLAEPAGGRKVDYLELNDTSKLVSAASKGAVDVFDPEVAAQPQIETIKNFLDKSGLSPEATSKEGNRKLAEAVTEALDDTTIAPTLKRLTKDGSAVSGGQAILTKLQTYIENKPAAKVAGLIGGTSKSALTDLRQLSKKNIMEALNSKDFRITSKEAGELYKAISQGYINVPMELRGLGDRGVDYLYRFNPLQKYYSRIQSALRYTYNPFFRTQEAVETRALSRLTSHNLIWNKSRAELDEAVSLLDESRIFSSSLYGEAAQDQVLGRITANITQGQKRDLAGLALDIANKKGISLEKMLAENADEIDDALRVVVQYPTKGILASPLARTLNLVFFPIRYNTKVTMLAAQALAKQPPSIQKATLHSLFQFGGWLKSDEGLQWQQQYADAIGVLNWVTPINSIEYTLNLLNGSIDNPADLGILGGLPIGILSQILDSQDIIHLNSPYVNPKTGDVIPKYVPESAKARAATAVSDVLGSMFTYPGRTLGLPGKQENIHRLVKNFIDTNKNEFRLEDQNDRLTPLEQNMVRVLQGDTSKETLDNLYISPAEGQFNGYTLPPANLNGILHPLEPLPKPRAGLPSKKGAKSKRAKTTAIPIR